MKTQPEREEGKIISRAKRTLIADMTRRGYCVVPVYGMESVSAETKSPLLFATKEQLITPDLLCIHPTRGDFWCEANGKGRPAWFRKYSRWQHGIDYALFQAYSRVQKLTGKRVNIAVQEIASPKDPDQMSELAPGSNQWLFIWLDEMAAVGEHMPEWPGGMRQPWRRGREGKGGWLWPRNAMTRDPFDTKTLGGLLF